jgi:hypothetical protein
LSRDICTEKFAEGFRDKIFDSEIIAALEYALNEQDYGIRSSIVQVFTAAIGQGVLCYFTMIFITKCSQRVFGTREFTLRLLLHLDVH